MTARLYGRTLGHGSHATVTEGFRAALHGAGLLAGLVELDRKHAPETPEPGGALAEHGVLTGMLAACGTLSQNARHKRRWAMVAPNSDRIPEDLAALVWRQCTDIMAPSRWARDVLVAQYEQLSGAAWQTGERHIVVVPHGVAREFKLVPDLRERARNRFREGGFDVVHMATSERERKGTIPLLEAWERVVPQLGDSPRLHLVLDAAAMSAAQVAIAERRFTSSTILVHERMDYAPYSMSAALGACHVVCQPSRSEGFGLTPLEARACGVPVIATACTGHSEHLAAGMPGVVIVEHGALAPIDDLPGASAPSVTSDAVATALLTAHAQWEALDCAAAEAAEQIRSEWAWPDKLSQWLGQLRS